MITYKTLNKDLEIVPVDDGGRFDRNLQNGDLVHVSDVDSIMNGVKVKLLTVFNELYYNPTYQNWGDRALLYVKRNNSQLTRSAVEEWVKKALEEMRRVKSVNQVVVESRGNPHMYQFFFSYTTIDDQEITGSVLV